MKKYLVLTFAFFTLVASAQVPGFQGKRFSFGYDFGFMHPYLQGANGKMPHLYHGGNMEFVVARSISIGVRYNWLGYKNYTPPPRFYGGSTDLAKQAAFGQFNSHTAAFYAKFFGRRKGYFAPVGPYFMVGGYYQYTNDIMPIYSDYDDIINGDADVLGATAIKAISHNGGITIGGGRHFILWRRLLLDFGLVAQLPAPNPNVFQDYNDNYKQAFSNLALRNLYYLKLGINFLAF